MGTLDRLTGRERRVRSLRRKGDAAMARRDWSSALIWYQHVLSIRPIPTIQVQVGHALKEAGQIEEAIAAYASVPGDAVEASDAHFHQATLLGRLGRREEAIAMLAVLLHKDPGHRGAFAELIHLGGRSQLPEDFQRRTVPDALLRLQGDVARLQAEIATLAEAGTYPLPAYDAFRQAFLIRPSPSTGKDELPPITILVDARIPGTAFLRATLLSLIDQTIPHWKADVRIAAEVLDHSVASFANIDSRITFSTSDKMPDRAPMLHLNSGTILNPNAIDWFAFVVSRTQRPVIWCDYDHAAEDEGGVLRYRDPRLWGVHDRDLIAQTSSPPAVLFIDCDKVTPPLLSDLTGAEWRRRVLLDVANAVHIPRLLASVLRLQSQVLYAPADSQIALWSTEPDGAPPTPQTHQSLSLEIQGRNRRPAISITQPIRPDDRMTLIIQTRNAKNLLQTAIESLRAKAMRPDRLDIVVVDNRSSDPAALCYLEEIGSIAGVKILKHNEGFNWSRANNIAAAEINTEYLIFANNDIEMLTPSWDDLLLGYLQRTETGAVGVRMLYPDGTIQHGGMLFGIGTGGPIHDGARLAGDETGPLDRFDITHTVAGVTGAFLGVRRSLFEDIGGFDETRLAIGYNDVDFCLAIRATGRIILYAPAIELIHHESKSRGYNVGRSRVAWDIGEFTSLRKRWTDDLHKDPSYNPHWSRNRPFDGYREPPLREILARIDESASAHPWRAIRNIQTP